MSAAAEVVRGTFTKRAERIMSNAGLYQLVQEMAGKVDDLPRQFGELHTKLDLLLELMNARIQTSPGSDD